MEPEPVLVVAYNPDFREFLLLAVGCFGIRAATATGEGTVSLVQRISRAAVLIDLLHPGSRGWKLVQQLKAYLGTRQTLVIALGGLPMDRDAEAVYRTQCDDYLLWPFDLRALELTLSKHL